MRIFLLDVLKQQVTGLETESEKHFAKNETVRVYHKHVFVREGGEGGGRQSRHMNSN